MKNQDFYLFFFVSMDLSANFFTGWDHYRLADMLRLPNLRYGKSLVQSNNFNTEAERYLNLFPNSIVSLYLQNLGYFSSKPGVHFPILHQAVVKHHFKPKTNNDIFLHLRIGDVCLADNDVRFNRKLSPKELAIHGLLLQYGQNDTKYYMQPWKHYALHLNRCIKLGASRRVVLVGGIHREGKGQNESIQLIQLYIKQLTKLGYTVLHKIGGNPDEDFILLSSVPFFIPGGGGYAQLIEDYRNFRK